MFTRMRQRAPRPIQVSTELLFLRGRNAQRWNLFTEIWAILTLFYDLVIGFPLWILEKFGYQLIPNVIQQIGCQLCSLCVIGAFLGITASVGIGLGVGLGVGLNCKETQYIYRNLTSINSTNATNSTIITNATNTTSTIARRSLLFFFD